MGSGARPPALGWMRVVPPPPFTSGGGVLGASAGRHGPGICTLRTLTPQEGRVGATEVRQPSGHSPHSDLHLPCTFKPVPASLEHACLRVKCKQSKPALSPRSSCGHTSFSASFLKCRFSGSQQGQSRGGVQDPTRSPSRPRPASSWSPAIQGPPAHGLSACCVLGAAQILAHAGRGRFRPRPGLWGCGLATETPALPCPSVPVLLPPGVSACSRRQRWLRLQQSNGRSFP